MHHTRNRNCAATALTASIVSAVALTTLGSSLALAVDTVTSKDAPDLTSVRAKIKAKDYQAALTRTQSPGRHPSTCRRLQLDGLQPAQDR